MALDGNRARLASSGRWMGGDEDLANRDLLDATTSAQDLEPPRTRLGHGAHPEWSTWREALGVIGFRPHLAKTIRIALVVGTILFCITQLNLVLEHRAGAVVWLKGAVTLLVPFCVANVGIPIATRRHPTTAETAADSRASSPQTR